jgi:hypothetical protein
MAKVDLDWKDWSYPSDHQPRDGELVLTCQKNVDGTQWLYDFATFSAADLDYRERFIEAGGTEEVEGVEYWASLVGPHPLVKGG